jgi:hypothetical protein
MTNGVVVVIAPIWKAHILVYLNLQYYFKCVDGKEAEAKRVVHNVIKKLLPNVFYEARIQYIITYHRLVLEVYITRIEARKLYPPVEYMKVSLVLDAHT